ncbi:MAG: DUF362 domain-containing protein [Candidatus Omnitrophica bacterium]|nr:DUF362 domain-containing protein [Candidatus Omnitrophota bacterium]
MEEKVAVVKCGSYDKAAVAEAVVKIFSLCDIREDAFRKLLFKPNMLSARTPEEGVTTHPAVVEAAVRYFKSSEKIIGDSPANINKPAELYWDKCGYKQVSEETGAPLVKFSSSFMLDIHLHPHLHPPPSRGRKMERTEVPVTDYLKEFSLINIAKLKTHGLTILTAAMKNLYGLIPGFRKSVLHSIFVSPLHFSEFLAVYYHAVKDYVSFNLVDAVVAMEGSGPAAGKLRDTGYLIGGRNAVAVDIACCKIIGIKPENIPYLKIYGERYGLPEIELAGDELVPVKDFDIPGRRTGAVISNRAFRPLLGLLGKHFKAMPVIDYAQCRKCRACVQVCPVKAISKDLKFDRKKCINCLCCFEVCPYKAISVKKSFIAKLFT